MARKMPKTKSNRSKYSKPGPFRIYVDTIRIIGGIGVSALAFPGLITPLLHAAGNPRPNDDRAAAFVAGYEKEVRPLEIAVNLAWWNANISGRDEDFKIKEEA